MLTTEQKKKAQEVSNKVLREEGDVGSCVLGYKLLYKGEKVISQPAQGSVTCDKVYKAVKEVLIEEFNLSESEFITDYGRMD